MAGGKAVGAAAGLGALALFFATRKTAASEPAPGEQPPPELPGEEDMDATRIIEAIDRLAEAIRAGGGVVPNTDDTMMTRLVVAAVSQALDLPDIPVPDDMTLLIKAWPTNGGLIYISNSRAHGFNVNQVYPLLPNEFVGYRIQNANLLTYAGNTVGDSVVVTVEQRRRS